MSTRPKSLAPPPSLSDYVGIPCSDKGRTSAGCDCWGLVVLAFKGCRGIVLPSYDDRYLTDADTEALAALIEGERQTHWQEIARGQERPFDLVLLRRLGAACHVGIVVQRGSMLHMPTGAGLASVIDRYDGLNYGRRVEGFYRYQP